MAKKTEKKSEAKAPPAPAPAAAPAPAPEKKEEKKIKLLLGIFNILPADEDTNLDTVITDVKKALQPLDAMVESFRIEEVAYGLKKIVAKIIFPEREGGTQPFEDALGQLSTVQRAECDMVSNYTTKL